MIQAEESVLKSWLHWFKLIFVFGKVIVICYMLVNAILARLNKFGRHD